MPNMLPEALSNMELNEVIAGAIGLDVGGALTS